MSSNNLDKYIGSYKEAFEVEETVINEKLEYQSIPEWDSIGHMGLIAALEEAYDISIDTDDVIDFSSFEKGKEILRKYKIDL
tara:strand:- start:1494 stop:1739 length:246 start_codon:yes stop_codon:yes gene_type:complete